MAQTLPESSCAWKTANARDSAGPVVMNTVFKMCFRPIAALTLAAIFGAAPAWGLADEQKPLRVVELFTSHGCYSCPPADKLLSQLIKDDPELIALEFHVDYWNDLVHRGTSWEDPFSDEAWTERQRDYHAARLKGRSGVYTPQMVINGRYAVVGSDVRRVNKALEASSEASIDVAIEDAGEHLNITVGVLEEGASASDILLIRYKTRAVTDITAGENRNMMLTNHNIVHTIERLGVTKAGQAQTFRVSSSPAMEDCAVIIQEQDTGPIVGGKRCP